jgi:NADH dehydrogenase
LATIGRRAAVVKFGRLELRGFVGWIFWSLAHIYFLIGLRNRFVVAFNWFWDYITFQRGARLITEVSHGSGRNAEPERRSTQQSISTGEP